uniref:ATP synthase mitochondrial F1 complex assembly factor 1 n=1 Tax=Hippocampus comes TaxID=109280 RepID=A0A3Q2XKI8_HIPCM
MWDRSDVKMAAALLQMTCRYRGMLAVRATGIRPLIPGLVPAHFRAFAVRKEPELEDNPYYNKYQEKIQKMRSCKPQEFKARMEKRHESKKEALGRSEQAEFVRVVERQVGENQTPIAKNSAAALALPFCFVFAVGGLWMKYYASKDTIGAVIPSHTYELMSARAESCPTFLYALPQEEGYEFFVGQWSAHRLHFTSLINIQTHGESAPSQMILHHFPDLREDKGIVLMTAELDPKCITVPQAQCLANQVQLFYGAGGQRTFGLVETFNHRPADFKHTSVIAELEQSGVGPTLGPPSSSGR